MEFAQRWYNDGNPGLDEPAQITAWSDEYISENDPLAKWIEENCLLDRDEKTGSAVLYGDYEDWCARNGVESKSHMAFSSVLVKRFRKQTVTRGAFFVGIRLRPVEERGDD